MESLLITLIFAIHILTTEHLWWLLMSASLLVAHCKCVCQYFTLPFTILLYHTYQMLSLQPVLTLYAKENIAIPCTLL